MDPIVATYVVKVTIRAPEGTTLDAPKIAEIEAAVETGVEVLVHASSGGETAHANAQAERTDN